MTSHAQGTEESYPATGRYFRVPRGEVRVRVEPCSDQRVFLSVVLPSSLDFAGSDDGFLLWAGVRIYLDGTGRWGSTLTAHIRTWHDRDCTYNRWVLSL